MGGIAQGETVDSEHDGRQRTSSAVSNGPAASGLAARLDPLYAAVAAKTRPYLQGARGRDWHKTSKGCLLSSGANPHPSLARSQSNTEIRGRLQKGKGMATARAKDTRSFEHKRLRLLVHIAASPAAAANQNQSGLVNVAVGDVSVLNDANVGVAAQVAANILRRQGRTDRGVGEPGRPKWGLTDRVQHGSGSVTISRA
jgi:hypothetical protein